MAQQRVLLIDSTQLEAWHAHGGHFTLESRHPATEEGHAAFERYVASHRRSRFYLLTDVVEEGFQYETTPAVSGADRKALISRRLNQYFYGSPLATGMSLGRETTGRRDERILFAALTRPAMFEPWLAALRKAEAQVAGLWSTPLLAPALLASIAPTMKRALLVSVGRGGVRQTYVEDGKLRFSRLAPLPGPTAGDIAAACEGESSKIHQYLVGQRIVPRGSVLPVLVLVHPSQRAVFAQQLRSTDEMEFVTTDILQAASAIGLRDAPTDSIAATLFAHVLLQKPPQEQFAPAEAMRLDHLGRVRVAMIGIGALALAGCLALATRQMLDTMTLRNQNELTIAQAQSDLTRYNNLLAALPPMPASADDLRALVGRFRDIEGASATPFPMYAEISRALEAMPQLDVDRIDWTIADSADPPADAANLRTSNAGLAKPGSVYSVATVLGNLGTASSSSQRAQLEAVNAFADELRKNEALIVTVIRMPFDVESQRALRSDSKATAEAPRFAVRIARKLG